MLACVRVGASGEGGGVSPRGVGTAQWFQASFPDAQTPLHLKKAPFEEELPSAANPIFSSP
jgi:hypothetical protein